MTDGVKNDLINERGRPPEELPEIARAEALGHVAAFLVLLAIKGDDFAPSATAVVRALQERRNASPSVLYVIEIGAPSPEEAAVAFPLEDELRDPRTLVKREAEMRSVLHMDDGAEAACPLRMAVGGIAETMVDQARRQCAELIVMGLSRHTAVGRALGHDTVRNVMALGGVPVLAVRHELTNLPKSVVVAVDFGPASIRAAHLARLLVDEHGSLHLVYIESVGSSETSMSAEALHLVHAGGPEAACEELVSELKPSVGMTIDTIAGKGSLVDDVAHCCGEIAPDLVAVGSHCHGLLDRLLSGSAAESIVANARYSALVVPPVAAGRS